jgi:hypothetical protein
VSSFFAEPANANPRLFTDPKAQQVFLNCIHYLTTHGTNTLFDRIEQCTSELVGDICLAKEFSAPALKDLLEKLKFRLECTAGGCNFADLVVPVAKPVITPSINANYNSAQLEELLSKLASSLQSPRAHAVLSGFVQRYINEVMDCVENELDTVKPLALAKLLPILSSSFPKITSTSYDSTLQQNIASPELYQYCQMVFSS